MKKRPYQHWSKMKVTIGHRLDPANQGLEVEFCLREAARHDREARKLRARAKDLAAKLADPAPL